MSKKQRLVFQRDGKEMLPQEVETSIGDFSIHTVAPEVFGGFVATPEGALIASPEKALFDVFYLSGTKPRTFSSLPEIELPDDFDFGKVRSWRVAASSTGATNPDTTFTGAPIAAVSLPISSAAATPGTKMQSAPAAR